MAPWALASAHIFSRLPEKLANDLFAKSRLVKIAADQTLFTAGDPGDGCYRVESGLMKVSVISPTGSERILAIFGPGSLIGEFAVIDGQPRSATVTAVRESLLRFISRAAYQEFAMGHAGDASRGRQLFADQRGAGCIKCHANLHAQQEKATLGPDLTTIGTQYSRAALIEHVLWPNLAIREGYQQWTITTSDGRVQSGLARGETADHYLLVDREQTLHAIDKLDVEERVSSPVSLMPEGLEQGLSLADFADLIAFLEAL
mgnify:CR=1 FL=1